MKRKSSLALTLVLLGSTGMLASCGPDPVDTAAFQDVDQCIKSGQYTSATCEKAFADAKVDNEKNAPAFKTKEDCEANFGAAQCQPTPATHPAGGGNFMPLMTGFLIGNMMGNNSSSHVYPQAIYRDRDRNYVNSSGSAVASQFGRTKITPTESLRGSSVFAPPVSKSPISRTGFGPSASSKSYGFGG